MSNATNKKHLALSVFIVSLQTLLFMAATPAEVFLANWESFFIAAGLGAGVILLTFGGKQ